MKKVLITGATGNIGVEIMNYINFDTNEVIAGVRDIEKAKQKFENYKNLQYTYFDFENSKSFEHALESINSIFLLRPPHISKIDKYFKPLIQKIKEKGVQEVIFLSVQGAEGSKVIPHHKIENLIVESGLEYIFLRPSYFMQNLTTTLKNDIQIKKKIVLPSGNAKFNWIDIKNIGETCSILIDRFPEFKNKAFELTGYENKSFGNVVEIINKQLQTNLVFQNVNPIKFYKIKKAEGLQKGMILVMLLLHFLPRFQKEPRISKFYEELTGKEPTKLIEFIEREKNQFYSS